MEILGRDIILEVREKGSETWLTLVCLRTYTMNRVTATFQTTSRCTGNFTKVGLGAISYTVPFEGDIDIDPAMEQAAYNWIARVEKNQTLLQWRAYSPDYKYFRSGNGYISTSEETAPQDGFATFSGTIIGTGEYYIEYDEGQFFNEYVFNQFTI
ncbi:hypothetical protein FKG96_10055 [Olivibacter sp. LS-1]|uniref:phage tail tube protein n=1 Tax=Olivibacter sp. LS-1 TaxID=2592345 RepID=UPI0011EA9865|nr:phage tail tube protein [Olivibacter sp. LS-1]QEL01137.1 hypothetical protein FKG96_10055 [Olivibacter sp. LS-1]